MENTVDPNWTAQTIPFRQPNLNQSSANLSHANETWATMSQEKKIKESQAQADQAKATADKANSTGGIIENTASGVFGGLIKSARSVVSAVADPVTKFFTGKEQPIPTNTIQEDVYNNAAAGHPDSNLSLAGQSVMAATDVVTAATGVEELAVGGAKLLEKTAGKYLADKTAVSVEKSAAKEALDVVTPKLTKKETEAALASGRGQGGGLLSKTKIAPDKRLLDVADATKGIVKSGVTGAENIKNVRTALKTESEVLAKNVEKIKTPVSVKGAISWVDAMPKPIEIEADATQSRKFDITRKALTKILQKNLADNPTVSSLLKSRKEFDALVEKEFPTLWEKDNATFRPAVKAMRDGLNDAIEANLPDGFGYKESLKKQSLFYDAIDNIAGKSSEEVGTSKLGRVVNTIKKHPVASAAIGYGAYKAEREVKSLTGL